MKTHTMVFFDMQVIKPQHQNCQKKIIGKESKQQNSIRINKVCHLEDKTPISKIANKISTNKE